MRPPANRDRRARFEQLAMPLSAALFRTARRLCRPPDDPADLVQETFLRAYRTFDSFREGTNEKAWLFTILYSIVSNRWQRDRRTPSVVSMDADAWFDEVLAGESIDPERLLLSQLGASVEIEAALSDLPEGHRAAVLLVDVEGLSYEDAAAALECPVGTVRSRLARARKQLFVALQPYAVRTRVAEDSKR